VAYYVSTNKTLASQLPFPYQTVLTLNACAFPPGYSVLRGSK